MSDDFQNGTAVLMSEKKMQNRCTFALLSKKKTLFSKFLEKRQKKPAARANYWRQKNNNGRSRDRTGDPSRVKRIS